MAAMASQQMTRMSDFVRDLILTMLLKSMLNQCKFIFITFLASILVYMDTIGLIDFLINSRAIRLIDYFFSMSMFSIRLCCARYCIISPKSTHQVT